MMTGRRFTGFIEIYPAIQCIHAVVTEGSGEFAAVNCIFVKLLQSPCLFGKAIKKAAPAINSGGFTLGVHSIKNQD